MAKTLVSRFDVGLFDLDGVCYLGAEAVAYAPESIRKAMDGGMRAAYVTNNASRTPESVAQQLVDLGIPATGDSIINSAQVGARLLRENVAEGAKVLVLGTQALRDEVTKVGLVVVESADDKPDAVIQGFYPEANWASLSEGALAIRAGALYVATNLDKTIPRERGLMVGNGSLVLAVSNSTGVTPLSSGKPEPEIFRSAARMSNAERPFAIGDNLDTDIQGAVAAGIPALHVLTGLATARDICIAPPTHRPTFLADDLRSLHESYPEIEKDGEWTVVREARCRWNGSEFEFGVGTVNDVLDLDSYRALVHAVWDAVDSGTELARIEAVLPELTVRR
ncbi:MAG: HAD-IIA family hydrolase [Ancrocorticia sp.]